jgi:hypothetical protein
MAMKCLTVRSITLLTLILSISIPQAFSQLPYYADVYKDTDLEAGGGLAGHFIDNNTSIDIVTTSHDPFEYGGLTWFYDSEEELYEPDQEIAPGHEAKFGKMIPGEKWRLVTTEDDLVLYEINESTEELDVVQTFEDEEMEHIAWGHIDGNQYMDLVASNSDVYIYLADGANEEFENPEDAGISYANQVALVRMEEYWNDDKKWDLVVATTATIKRYANDGNGGFNTTAAQAIDPFGVWINDMAIGDINGDGFDDIVVTTSDYYDDCYISTYLNNGTGSFETTANQSQFVGGGVYIVSQIALGEFDYNGFPDLAILYDDVGYAAIFPNISSYPDATGYFDFGNPEWYGEIDTNTMTPYEMMFMPLSGSAQSLLVTGQEDGTTDYNGLYIWYNPSCAYAEVPKYVTFDLAPGNHPRIKWAEMDVLNIDEFNIYRALMEDDETRPTRNDWDLLATVSSSTNSYTDETVTIHTQNDNYFIWYTVTSVDDDENESLIHQVVHAWGYYEDGEISETIILNQPGSFKVSASPNPFNPFTQISYDLPDDSYVDLRVYNAAGQEVATLADGQRVAGTHVLSWDASHLTSGIYFARIKAGEHHAAQKLLLAK